MFEREIQVLRASFGVGGKAAVAGFADFFERFVAGEMNDVNGRAGHFSKGDGAGSGFGFGGGGARERVILGRAFSFGEGLLDDDVDGATIFGVHADEAVVIGGLAHGIDVRGVLEQDAAGMGAEVFDAG